MKKSLIITIVLALASLLVVISGCSGPNTVPVASTTPTNTTPIPNQTAGIPSQGIAPGLPPLGVPSPAPGSSSAGISTPGVAIASPPAASTFITQPSFVQPASGQEQSIGIWVTGQGQVSAIPDTATLTLGVDSQASTVAEAQKNASDAMNAVTQVLKSKGVADNDITTVGFNIYPSYNYKSSITGYQVSNSVTVKIRKIADTGSIIDGVTSAGGNLIRINAISFSIDDPAPFLKQARQMAVADANAKASQLASFTGVTLGLPTFVTETTSNYLPVPMYFAAGAAAPVPATPINPGETQISVNVQIVYAIQ